MHSKFLDNSNPRILVTGAAGQLGMEFREVAHKWPGLQFLFVTRNELDISLESHVQRFIFDQKPHVVINCAAYTNVEKAEEDHENAFLINGTAVGWLAKACAEVGSLLIHYSTDYVFDGLLGRPYVESDLPAPINVYGASKWAGEKLLDEHLDRYYIFRVSWLYSTFGHNFFRTMLRLAQEKEELRVVNDQVASPTYARLLAEHSMQVIERSLGPNHHPYGLYHYAEEGEASWYDFACAIVANSGQSTPIYPVSSAEFPTKAKRPHYSKLNGGLLQEKLGLRPPPWREALQTCFKNMTTPT